jgi:hypothetical protein
MPPFHTVLPDKIVGEATPGYYFFPQVCPASAERARKFEYFAGSCENILYAAECASDRDDAGSGRARSFRVLVLISVLFFSKKVVFYIRIFRSLYM